MTTERIDAYIKKTHYKKKFGEHLLGDRLVIPPFFLSLIRIEQLV